MSYSNEETTKFKIEGRADVEKLTSGMVTDTLLIGRVADLSVYVCRADYTHKAEYTLINELAIASRLPIGSFVMSSIPEIRIEANIITAAPPSTD